VPNNALPISMVAMLLTGKYSGQTLNNPRMRASTNSCLLFLFIDDTHDHKQEAAQMRFRSQDNAPETEDVRVVGRISEGFPVMRMKPSTTPGIPIAINRRFFCQSELIFKGSSFALPSFVI
jgi:hypothetical protein